MEKLGLVLLCFFCAVTAAGGVTRAALPPACQALIPATPIAATLPLARADDWHWVRHYQMLNRLAATALPDLLLIGDSIVARWPAALVNMEFPGRAVFNAGADGDHTQHVLWRLIAGNLPSAAPKAIVLLIGTNNMGSSGTAETPAAIAGGVAAIVDLLRNYLPESRIVIVGILPRGARDDIRRPIIAKANALVEACSDGAQIRFADAGAKFVAPDGTVLPGLLKDGVHPTARGYALIADAVNAALAYGHGAP